jgi:GT2 family glycosyltransferase
VSGPRVGAAVLADGGGGEHGPLLEGLVAAGLPPRDIVVVHNPARPGERAPALAAGCALIEAERNLGYAAGMNCGIAWLRDREARLLLLLTHDARLRPGGLDALLAAAESAPAYGILAPALVVAGTDEPFSYGGLSRRSGATEHIRARPGAQSGIAPCDWVDGGTLLVRAEAIERVGVFEERFWSYCEESELCLRVRRAGLGVGVVLGAVADQDPGGGRRPGVWSYLLTRNGAEYARRAVGWRGAAFVVARAAWLVAFSLVRVVVRSVRPRPGGVAEPWALAVGTARGAVDFLRRRWGPPPPGLPGMGDVGNV